VPPTFARRAAVRVRHQPLELILVLTAAGNAVGQFVPEIGEANLIVENAFGSTFVAAWAVVLAVAGALLAVGLLSGNARAEASGLVIYGAATVPYLLGILEIDGATRGGLLYGMGIGACLVVGCWARAYDVLNASASIRRQEQDYLRARRKAATDAKARIGAGG
jgi:hypothetical protein